MQITITIDTSNAAFEDNGVVHEVVKILRRLANRILDDRSIEMVTKVMDSNGNSVGTFDVEKDPVNGPIKVSHLMAKIMRAAIADRIQTLSGLRNWFSSKQTNPDSLIQIVGDAKLPEIALAEIELDTFISRCGMDKPVNTKTFAIDN